MDDGVVYLELRTTPRDTGELNREQLIATITDAIWAFEAENPGRLQTRLILCVDRRHDLPTASSVLDLALRHRASSDGRDGVVVGLDLCGDPTVRANGEISSTPSSSARLPRDFQSQYTLQKLKPADQR
jgi:adenosine deaminase